MPVPQELIEIATRHQVYLERLKTGESKKAEKFLRDVNKTVTAKLAGKDITDFTRRRLQKLQTSLKAALAIIGKEFSSLVVKESVDLAKYEAKFEIAALDQVVVADFAVPTAAALNSAVFSNPLTMKGADNGNLLKPFIRDLTGRTLAQVTGAIASGYYQGQTTNQILQTVRGTRAAKYTDGIIHNMNRAAGIITRTSLQHAAVQARQEVWRRNKDIISGEKWISTLDGRTSAICRSYDGREFPLDKGPRPPIHMNCRSTVVAVLHKKFDFLDEGATRAARGEDRDGKSVVTKVPANQTYYSWLKTQPKSFQDATIGIRRARLMRDGGLTSDEFARLNLSNNFKEISLANMKRESDIALQAFKRADITEFVGG